MASIKSPFHYDQHLGAVEVPFDAPARYWARHRLQKAARAVIANGKAAWPETFR